LADRVVIVIGHFLAWGAPADPLAVQQTVRIDTPYVRGCLANHAPSLIEPAEGGSPCVIVNLQF
jgi:hypothetical protein